MKSIKITETVHSCDLKIVHEIPVDVLATTTQCEALEMGVPLASYLKAAHKLLGLKRSDKQIERIAAAMEARTTRTA